MVAGDQNFRELLILTTNSSYIFAQICYQEIIVIDCGA